jgi:hypothetical protein
VVNAKLVGTLDQSVGTHEAVFKSDEGHLFPGEKTELKVSYTIEPKLTGQQCWAKDATADVKTTAPTCTANGSAATINVVNAKLVGTLDQSVGTHEAVFKSDEGHLFPGEKTELKVSYTVKAQLTGEQCGTFEDDSDGSRTTGSLLPLIGLGLLGAVTLAGVVGFAAWGIQRRRNAQA